MIKDNIECELIGDDDYYLGDFVKKVGDGKVSHIPTEGRPYREIMFKDGDGQIVSIPNNKKALVCFNFWENY